jgi:hypothetical protein
MMAFGWVGWIVSLHGQMREPVSSAPRWVLAALVDVAMRKIGMRPVSLSKAASLIPLLLLFTAVKS